MSDTLNQRPIRTDAQLLDDFFNKLEELGAWYIYMVGKEPIRMFINPVILQRLSTMDGFYQRKELRTQVTTYSPVISRMVFSFGVVEIIESYIEQFLHFE